MGSPNYYVRISNVPNSASFSDIINFFISSDLNFEPDDICIVARSNLSLFLEFPTLELADAAIEAGNTKLLLGFKINAKKAYTEEVNHAKNDDQNQKVDDILSYLVGNGDFEEQSSSLCSFDVPRASSSVNSTNDSSQKNKNSSTDNRNRRRIVENGYSNNVKRRRTSDEVERYSSFETPFGSHKVEVKIKDQRSISCRIIMLLPRNIKQYSIHRLKVKGDSPWSNDSSYEEKSFDRQDKNLHRLVLKPGWTYDVTFEVFVRNQENTAKQLFGQDSTKFISWFSNDELLKLYDMALKFTGSMMHPFDVFYRCKPHNYFENIYKDGEGPRVMMPYNKDLNGQAANPLNGRLQGLFFSAHKFGETLPTISPFGEVRMIVKAPKLLDPKSINLYFSDFYCNSEQSLHYVTVVVCRINSEADKFSKQHLIPLPLFANNFLKITDEGKFFVSARDGLLIEIYYTEPISLFDAERFELIGIIGKGSSKPLGIPHNKQCRKCNLYPVESTHNSR